MATSKRPALRKQDRVTLSPIKRVIPAYGGKPFVGRDTVLTVSHLTGTGSKRNPWHVVVTDGTHFWHLEPDDVSRVETTTAHSTMKPRGSHRDLDQWLNHHGYHHAHSRKEKTPPPYTVSTRMSHARTIHQTPTDSERIHTLSAEQLEALHAFAKANGRSWKAKLNTAWTQGHYYDYNGTNDYGSLQQVRNRFGPTWLSRFSFNRPKTHSMRG